VQLAGQHGILQIHPTRRCNLSCLHCYSDSGPTQREELSPDLLGVVIDDAAELGYRTLSVSGGEPLMYRPLPEVLAHARGRGLRTLVTTNGTLSDRRRLGPLAAHIDLLAISLDGPPAEHDLMRAMPGAFASLLRRLEAVRATGMTFGFLFTLTQHNVHQLEWAVDFAIEQGAAMLQIHPLDATGRGASLASSMPDRYECAVAVLEVARLRQSAGDRLYIHLDLAIRPALAAHAKRFQDAACDGSASLAEVVTPLVVEPDGRCVPLEYGFPAQYALGNVRTARLRDLAAAWLSTTLPSFNRLCRTTLDLLSSPEAPPASNWYLAVGAEARATA